MLIHTPISHLEPDQEYHELFLVEKSSRHTASNNKPYIRLTLKDITGKISGIIWECNRHFKSGSFLLIAFKTKLGRDGLEFTSNDVNAKVDQDKPSNIFDYIHSPNALQLDECEMRLKDLLEGMEDSYYMDLLNSAQSSFGIINMLRQAPYGETGPLAYPGGLLVFSTQVIDIALQAAKSWANTDHDLNLSLIIAAGIFRNIGWYTTTKVSGSNVEVMDSHYMTTIYRSSFRFVHDTIRDVENRLEIQIPEAKKQALENTCNPLDKTHTIEGKLIAHACNMADTMYFGGMLLNTRRQGNWAPNHVEGLFVGHNE
jgi:hypothetical protein